jgi:hypothetical protein
MEKSGAQKATAEEELPPNTGEDKLELLLSARIWFLSNETKYGCGFLCLPTLPNTQKKNNPTHELFTYSIGVSS